MTATIPSTVDERLAQLREECAALNISRTQAEQDAATYSRQIEERELRIITIHGAAAAIAGLPALAPEQEWRDLLTSWRKTLCDELLALPPRIRDSHTLGVQTNLTISIRIIDFGISAANDTGYNLTTLRLGQLMRESGYEPVGADPNRGYSGVMPWFGSVSEVERRIAKLHKQRDDAQTRLDDALMDDDARAKAAAQSKARIDALNAAPRRKVRGDGSQYDRYPDGRVVEVEA